MSARVAVMGSRQLGHRLLAILAEAGCQVTCGRDVPSSPSDQCRSQRRLPTRAQLPQHHGDRDPAPARPGPDRRAGGAIADPARQSRRMGIRIPHGVPVVSLMKGVELGTTKRMSEVIAEVGGIEAERIVIVSGPNLAKEIAMKQPAASTVACVDMAAAERVARLCVAGVPALHDTDVVGTEICGATKNVVALAVGMAEGLGLGDNTKATIITRGLAETTRFGLALGAEPQTFLGLAGVGDLIATCMSPLSRNHSFGSCWAAAYGRRGRGRDEADDGGREVVPVDPLAGTPWGRHADRRAGGRGRPRWPACREVGPQADVARPQGGEALTPGSSRPPSAPERPAWLSFGSFRGWCAGLGRGRSRGPRRARSRRRAG